MNEKTFPTRKPTRLQNYDYSQNGRYFVTVCVAEKEHLLAHYRSRPEIVGAGCGSPVETFEYKVFKSTDRAGRRDLRARPQEALILTRIGHEVEKTVQYIAQNYENVKIENAVVMPNHIHLLILLDDFESRQTGGRGFSPKTGTLLSAPQTFPLSGESPAPTKCHRAIKILHDKAVS